MRKIIFIMLLVLPSLNLVAQDVELGFRLESQSLRKYYSNGYKAGFALYPYLSCLQLDLAVYPVKNISIEGRFGREFLFENYIGLEYGVYSKYYFGESYYLTGGIAGHSNESSGGSIYGGSSLNTLIMPAAGAGLRFSRFAAVEVLFQYAGNKKIGGSWDFGRHGEVVGVRETVEWLMKVGLVFGWKL